MQNDYLSRTQLATLLHCCVRTIYNYERTGAIPLPTIVGRKHLWLKSDLITFIKAKNAEVQAELARPAESAK